MNATVTLVRMFLTVIVCFLFTIAPLVAGQQRCQTGKYGVNCRLECHCTSGCDPTSGCRGQCASGWDGPTCQRQNVALHKQAGQSSNYSSSSYLAGNSVDGVVGNSLTKTPCTHTAEGKQTAYWTVTLNQLYEISGFRIYNRDETVCTGSSQCGARLNGFTLSVGNTSSNTSMTCYRDNTTSGNGPGAVITEDCQNGVAILGNFVNISLTNGKPLTLCEVEIFACSRGTFGPDCEQTCGHCANGEVCDTASGHCPGIDPRCESGYTGYQCKTDNVALHRPAIQSSTGRFALSNSTVIPFDAQYAVDGIVGHDLFKTPCTHTADDSNPAYWSVTLDQVYEIFGFTIYNRGECCAERLHGFILSVGNSSTNSYTTCYQDQTTSGNDPGQMITEYCQNGITILGNTVNISLETGRLALCEVQIFACLSGTWGDNCERPCYCWNDASCLQKTGECPANGNDPTCKAGYRGTQCNTECTAGTFGADCTESCGYCAQGRTVCNVTSGSCPNRQPRCESGYNGEQCKTVCDDHYWGPDCEHSCGHCLNNTACNKSSGICPQAQCAAGYVGDLCTTECTAGTFGLDCKQGCGHCAQGAVCNITSGNCPDAQPRCEGGYSGEQCKTVCDDHYWGPDCEQSCGHCLNNAACNKSSGVCPHSRCSAGYVGDLCITECNGTRWGQDCLQKCGHCWNNTDCDGVTGVCNVTDGNPRCEPGYLGEECREKCGHCWNNTTCDSETGVCPDTSPRCNPGYLGDNCTLRNCSEGKYGSDCQYVCHCGPEVTCDPLSGCVGSSCSPGWDGKTCQRQNVALNRTAAQSSTGGFGGKSFSAEYSVDGNLFDTPCTHTDSSYPSAEWNVTLTEVTSVYRFRIYNKNTSDCNGPCEARLSNFSLSVGNSSSYTTCYQDHTTDTNGTGFVINTVCERGPVWGDQVRISLDTGEPLTLCEVQIFVCAPGWYGEMCEKECNTATRCLRCDPARILCTQCAPGSWGEDCENTCGNCWDKVCLQTNGTCVRTGGNPRCQVGYQGTDCLTKCLKGTWGEDCSKNCSENCINDTCHAQSGNCSSVTEEEKQKGDSKKVGDIVGGVIGALLAVACVIIVVVLFLRRRQQKPSTENDQAEFDGKLENLQSSKHVREMSSETENVNYEVSNPYENTAEGTKMVPVATFGSYLAEKIATKELITEFESFKVGLTAEHDAADRPENQGKSRFRGLLAYDHSRVVLKAIPEPTSTDYINASYINGYNELKKYIASQGPTKVMINDFMLMIWEKDVGKVVMLTNLVEDTKQKCLQYWPDEGSSEFGVITVTCEHEQMYADFVIRTLELTNSMEKGKTKLVTLFHFISWPDHGAPAHPTVVLDFRDKVISYTSALKGPTVVHCSAGIGRTGTYIALDNLMNQAKQSGKVDIPLCVTILREQRVNMVQTQEQYDFLHQALLEAIQLSHTCIPCVDFSTVYDDLCLKDPHSTETKLKAQFRVLGELTPSQSKSSLATANHPDNQMKNRSPDILAGDSSRPFLTSVVPGSNDYINAVFLPSYKMKRAFIITQMPLPNTVVDFWRLVYEQSISTIVMLNTEDNIGKNDGIYWPDKSGEFGPFSVEESQVNEYDDFSVCKYQLSYKNTKLKVPTKQFRCKFWPRKPCPKSPTALLALIECVEQWRKESGNKPVIVHCRDGVSKSGVYCAAAAIMERLVEDKDVNIVQKVKQMRIHRPQIITDLEQFDFLHRVVIEYLNSFQTYSNFM